MKQIIFLYALLLGLAIVANPARASEYFAQHLDLSFLAQKVLAATGSCTPIYGGNQNNCPDNGIIMDKTVQNPQTQGFVDNLGVNDPKFQPDQTVVFRLTVRNTSNNTVKDIKVRDVLPDFVDYVSGTGTFDKNRKTLSYTISELRKDETRTVEVKAKVYPENRLPAQNTSCVVNQAIVTVGNNNTQDNAQFCIQRRTAAASGSTGFPSSSSPTGTTKGGQTVQPTPTPSAQTKGGQTQGATTKGGQPLYPQPSNTSTPSTGPEVLGLFTLLPAGLAGILLRKKA